MIGKTRRTKLSKKTTRVSKTQKKHKKEPTQRFFIKSLEKWLVSTP